MKKWQAYQVLASTEIYVASEVDAKLKEYDEDNLLLSQAASLLSDRCNSLETVIEAQRHRIAEL